MQFSLAWHNKCQSVSDQAGQNGQKLPEMCLKLPFIVVLRVSKEASVVDYNEWEVSPVRRLYRSTERMRGGRGQTDSGGGRRSLNPTTHPHWLADAPPLLPSNLHSVGI